MLTLLLAGALSPASACSIAVWRWAPDARIVDVVPPEAPTLVRQSISRGRAYETDGDVEGIDSCRDLGQIVLALDADDETSRDRMGWRAELVGGDAVPEGLDVDPDDVQRHAYMLLWRDGASDDQEPIDLTLAVYAVDDGGNESEPTLVHVTDPGRDVPDAPDEADAGCSHAGGPAWVALPALLAIAGRRRRLTE